MREVASCLGDTSSMGVSPLCPVFTGTRALSFAVNVLTSGFSFPVVTLQSHYSTDEVKCQVSSGTIAIK